MTGLFGASALGYYGSIGIAGDMNASPRGSGIRVRPKGQAPKRAELSRDRIITKATELIDASGLDALNMRDLGVMLGASTMSVYRHFRSKSELLDAVVDQLLVVGFAPGAMKRDWREQARAMSLGMRSVMLKHPNLADLMGKEFRRSATSLRVNTEFITRLSETGVPRALLAESYWAISCYTAGHALHEAHALRRRRSGPGLTQDRRTQKLAALLASDPEVKPDSVPIAADILSRPLDDTQFLFGLNCLIDGIAARLRR